MCALAVVSRRLIRLQADHGRGLKLVGGMLAALAIVLLLKPALLEGWAGSLAVVAMALLAAGTASIQKKWTTKQF